VSAGTEVKVFNLPDVGEGLVEARIAEIHVKVGDAVARFDVLMDVETDKSVVELTSPWAGTVHRILVEADQYADVGSPVAEIAVAQGGDGDA
jgi:2-oxoisovalerate dehydrogenase E2 component (dihydrolipoyl transacylase)